MGSFFFLWGTCNYLRRRSFGTFWMIQTPCVFSKKHRGNARHPFRRRIRTISNGSDLCIPSGVGGAQCQWSHEASKMDDDRCMMYIYIYVLPSWELRKSQKKWLLINEFPFSKMGYVSSLDGMYINFTQVHMSPFYFEHWNWGRMVHLKSPWRCLWVLRSIFPWNVWVVKKRILFTFCKYVFSFIGHSCKFEGFVSENVTCLFFLSFFLSSSMRTFQPTEISEWRDDWLKRGFPVKMSAHCRWTTTTCHQATIGATNSKWACGVLWRSY